MTRRPHRAAWLLVAMLGCHRGDSVKHAAGDPATILEQARARPVPDPLKARFTIKVRSKPLDIAGTTGGGLLVDRPGLGRLEVFGPMGGSLLTVTSDGAGLAVLLPGKRQDLVAKDAEYVLREATGGVAGLDDILAVLVGDLPFDDAPVDSLTRVGPKPGEVPKDDTVDREGPKPDEGILAVLRGPKGTTVEALLDPDLATPKRLLARDPKGNEVLWAVYDPFELSESVGAVMPTRVEIYVPALDLSIEAKFRDWTAPTDALPPFSLDAPADFEVRSLEEAIRGAAGKL